jgi:glycosyltransferase involved in cell wall biosynthesis
MKLCIVVPYFTPFVRGNEYGLAESLTKLGHDVTIITSRAKAPREVTMVDIRNHRFKVEYLPTILNIPDTPLVLGMDLKGYDVALLQEDYPFICHKAYSEAKKRGIKTILSSERTYYPEGIKGFALRRLDKRQNKELRDGADALTAHCTAAKAFMVQQLGVKRDIDVIHVGVDTDLFKPTKPQGRYLPTEGVNLLTVARLHRYKGLDYLVEAMSLLRETKELKLYIMGKGREEANLKSLVKRLHLEGTVTFMETPIPNTEMPSLYGECDIYIQPSIIEPFGIAVLEAMACGKPVIGTKVGGMLDTIKDGETGFLVAPKNPKELADRIKALKNEEVRANLGEKARILATENFDWPVIGKKYQETIKRLPS